MRLKVKLNDKRVASKVKKIIAEKLEAYNQEPWKVNYFEGLEDEVEAPSMQENVEGEKPPVYEENIVYTTPEQTGNGYAPIPKDWPSDVSNGYAPGTRTNTEKTEQEQIIDEAKEQLENSPCNVMPTEVIEAPQVQEGSPLEIVIDDSELDSIL